MSFASLIRAGLAAGALGVALGAAPAMAQEPFRMLITEPTTPLVPNSVMELADQLGYFEAEGLDVEFIRLNDTPTAVAALLAGEGDMANISLAAALAVVAQDQLDLRAVASPDKFLPFTIVAKNDISELAGLVGRSYGVASVGSLDYSLSNAVFADREIDASRINFIAVGPPPQRGAALLAGQIDATTMSIGVFLGLEDKSNIHVLVGVDEFQEASGAVLNKVNVVPAEVLEERRDDVVAFLRAIVRASRDFNADPSKWVTAMQTARADYPAANLEILGQQFVGAWSVNGGMDAALIARSVDATYQTQDLAGLPMVDMAKWVDFSVIDEVLADLGTDASADPAGR